MYVKALKTYVIKRKGKEEKNKNEMRKDHVARVNKYII